MIDFWPRWVNATSRTTLKYGPYEVDMLHIFAHLSRQGVTWAFIWRGDCVRLMDIPIFILIKPPGGNIQLVSC